VTSDVVGKGPAKVTEARETRGQKRGIKIHWRKGPAEAPSLQPREILNAPKKRREIIGWMI
jgi:hypothetical protein